MKLCGKIELVLAQQLQELSRLVVKPREHLVKGMIAEVAIDRFAQHPAEVCGYREVAALVKLRLVKPRPAPVNFAPFDRAAHHEHYVGVTVIGATITIFAGGAAELRHRD